MKVPLSTWLTFKKSYGDFDARQRLAFISKRAKIECSIRLRNAKRDLLTVVTEFSHIWPENSPMENRKRYSHVIRTLIERSRAHRLTILGYCAPGVSRQLLP